MTQETRVARIGIYTDKMVLVGDGTGWRGKVFLSVPQRNTGGLFGKTWSG